MDILFTAIILAAIIVAIVAGQFTNPDKKFNSSTSSGQTLPATPSGNPPPPPVPTPPIQINSTDININDLRYPNSSMTASDNSHLTLQSSDNTDDITNWYKAKIVGLGAKTKSFVTTKTNDNVLNNLVGATAKAKIQVKISKSSGVNTVSIDVTISSP